MLLRILLSQSLARPRGALLRHLEERGLVFQAARPEDLWALQREESIDVVVARPSDLGPDPAKALGALRAAPRPPEVVLVTSEPAGPLLAAGATILAEDLRLPTRLEIVRLALDRAADARRRPVDRRGSYLERTLNAFGTTSRVIRRFHEEARRAAASDAQILIRGEVGTGKTWLGPVLHIESRRAKGSFQRFSCAAVDEDVAVTELFGHGPGAVPGRTRAGRGRFEKAHGGSLFLENADRASAEVQRKLAAALEQRTIRPLGVDRDIPIDVRLLASIRVRPVDAGDAGDAGAGGNVLLPDLRRHFELAELAMPTLRERAEDVPELAAAALQRCRRRYGSSAVGFSEAALDALCRHTWPGNVKELWSVVERAALLTRGEEVRLQDLPADLLAEGGPATRSLQLDAPWLGDPERLPTLREVRTSALELVDRTYLDRLLRATRGRVGEAARRAEIDPRSMHALMRRHELRKQDYKGTQA